MGAMGIRRLTPRQLSKVIRLALAVGYAIVIVRIAVTHVVKMIEVNPSPPNLPVRAAYPLKIPIFVPASIPPQPSVKDSPMNRSIVIATRTCFSHQSQSIATGKTHQLQHRLFANMASPKRRFAPLGRPSDGRAMQLKGVVFDMDGTLCMFPLVPVMFPHVR